MEDDLESVLDVDLPLVKLPIIPGKNVMVICKVIAMNHLLRHYGYDSAKIFKSQLAEQIKRGITPSRLRRGIEWFEHDFESREEANSRSKPCNCDETLRLQGYRKETCLHTGHVVDTHKATFYIQQAPRALPPRAIPLCPG